MNDTNRVIELENFLPKHHSRIFVRSQQFSDDVLQPQINNIITSWKSLKDYVLSIIVILQSSHIFSHSFFLHEILDFGIWTPTIKPCNNFVSAQMNKSLREHTQDFVKKVFDKNVVSIKRWINNIWWNHMSL